MATVSLGVVLPFLMFSFVLAASYALFSKTRMLGENGPVNFIISFALAMVFILVPSASRFTVASVPWLVVLAVFTVLILFLVFSPKKIDDFAKNHVVSLILVSVVMLIFLIAAVNVFGPFMNAISNGSEGIYGFILTPSIIGAVILIVLAAVVSRILMKDR